MEINIGRYLKTMQLQNIKAIWDRLEAINIQLVNYLKYLPI